MFTSALEAKLTDSVQDGAKIPVGQQCDKFVVESSATPKLHVMDIPSSSDSIVFDIVTVTLKRWITGDMSV